MRRIDKASAMTKLNLVLLDACRDNPFLNRMKKVATRGIASKGLARVDTVAGDTNLLIGYAAAPGQVASHGSSDNSPYTAALLRHLTEPGTEIEAALRNIAKDVVESTGGVQRPYKSGSMLETVSLLGSANTATPSPVKLDPCRNAAASYAEIKNVTDTRLLEDHLRRFENCGFALLVEKQSALLNSVPVAMVIGNSRYRELPQLPKAAEDARAVGLQLGLVLMLQTQ